MLDPLADRSVPPGDIQLAPHAGAADAVGDLDQALGRVAAAVEDHVLDPLEQLWLDVLVDRELTGVDDPEVKPCLDRVEKERGVHRLADDVVAAEREAQVGDTTGGARTGTPLLEARQALDECARVVVVLLDARCDREHVRVEHDVLGREADLLDEQVIGAAADRDPSVGVGRLPFLVERHHDDARAVVADAPCLAQELLLAFLERDRVDHALALQGLQAGLEHRPARAVDHDRQPGDLGLGRDHVQEPAHRLLALQQVCVHVHVQEVGAAANLLERHVDGGTEVAGLDEPPEARGARDVRALTDQDEPGVRADLERLQAAEPRLRQLGTNPARRQAAHGIGDRVGVLRRRAAAGADDVQEPVLRELAQERRGDVGCLVVAAERVREAGVGMARREARRDPRQVGDVGAHLAGAE